MINHDWNVSGNSQSKEQSINSYTQKSMVANTWLHFQDTLQQHLKLN